MNIQYCPMGSYMTNCYIVTVKGKDLIIDPGENATKWVIKNVSNPVAILNTHGHFDHVWSNAELQKELGIPLYCPKEDVFMLEDDPMERGTPKSTPNYMVKSDELLDISDIKVQYRHFPGHTPGTSIIEIEDIWLSGDFLFKHSVGRWDFPYSSGIDMLKSLQKAIKIENNYTIYPGHGDHTTLKAEQKLMPYWIRQVGATI